MHNRRRAYSQYIGFITPCIGIGSLFQQASNALCNEKMCIRDSRNFNYAPVENMAVDQDAIAFRLYVTPSETQPSIRTEYGNEATKVQNLYVYLSLIHICPGKAV